MNRTSMALTAAALAAILGCGPADEESGKRKGDAGAPGECCTYTQGYWKNHEDSVPEGPFTLGGVTYEKGDVLALMGTPTGGDASLILAHQAIAALLNAGTCADPLPAPVQAALEASGEWMTANGDRDGRLPFQVPADSPEGQAAVAYSVVLDDFNNGRGGRPHCGDKCEPAWCDDGRLCTTDTCLEDGTCGHSVDADWCLIDGVCRPGGFLEGKCRTCDLAASQVAWTYRTDHPCDDGDPCTRDDVCVPGGSDDTACHGTPYSCDDGRACTTDACLGDGGCAHVLEPGWCPTDAGCIPPSIEACNGVDDDCDGEVDEELAVACYDGPEGTAGTPPCAIGTAACAAGTWGDCKGQVVPAAEACNGVDDDCDGEVDEELAVACYDGPEGTAGTPPCTVGTSACAAGTWGECLGQVVPVDEACNGIDDDCDGPVDEELAQDCSKANGYGTCRGTETCIAGAWQGCTAKTPAAETCNGTDDDCDGAADEALAQVCTVANDSGTCKGIETCIAGVWAGCTAKTPGPETCNGIDDDCDGAIDEALVQACTVANDSGTCEGTETCIAGAWAGCSAKLPAPETCNGIDDDCDGPVDEALAKTCWKSNGTGTCEGVETCFAGAWAGCTAKTPATETCNGVDDDCDGPVDEDLAQACTVANESGTCGGVETCLAGVWIGCSAKIPAFETCNNLDDDCDGSIDESLLRDCQIPNDDGTCKGTETCTAGEWGGCTAKSPAPETCNNVDDDCDGAVDEALAQACSVGNGYGTCTGTETCDAGSWVGCDAKTPAPESCNGADDDCDGSTDEGLTQACSVENGYGTCQGIRPCPDGTWGDCTAKTPAPETCNAVDDDCDGSLDENLSQTCTKSNAYGTCTGTETCTAGMWLGCTAKTAAAETCNNADDDCDGNVDESLTRACSKTNGHGTCTGTETCSAGAWVGCNAKTPAAETCNNADDDCDGLTDEWLTRACSKSNAYGTCTGTETCSAGAWVGCSAKTPAGESCNGADDDCDGAVDEGVKLTFYRDLDGDGYGDPNVPATGCSPPSGYVATGGDCDDSPSVVVNGTLLVRGAFIHPGASTQYGGGEDCGSWDSDCNPATGNPDGNSGNCKGYSNGSCPADYGFAGGGSYYERLRLAFEQKACGGRPASTGCGWGGNSGGSGPNPGNNGTCDGGGYPFYYCVDAAGVHHECVTPLVLVFGISAVRFAPHAHCFALDPDRPGAGVPVAWPTAATPWLAFDRNGNGRIDDGSELFGSSTRLAGGGLARNGFEALADLDGNGDAVLDARDAAWERLLVWRDDDRDGVSQPGELTPVAAGDLVSIPLAYTAGSRCAPSGDCEGERGQFVFRDAKGREQTGEVVDVYLRTTAGGCEIDRRRNGGSTAADLQDLQ